ncbi:hypothetical protein [Streptomyces sp. NPDC002537]
MDGGARPIGNSTYEQAVFNIRLYQAVDSITGYAQTVTRDIVGDLRQIELDGTVTDHHGFHQHRHPVLRHPDQPAGRRPPVLYKVYRGTATGTESLVGIVDAFDTTGTATTSIIDTGTNLLTNSSANTGPSAYQSGNTGAFPRSGANAQEDVYLVPRDPDFLVRPYTRDMQILPLAPTVSAPGTLPFAVLTDTTLACHGSKYVGRLSRLSATL